MMRLDVALNQTTDDLLQAGVDVDASGVTVLIPAIVGELIKVYKVFIVLGGNSTVEFEDTAGNVLPSASSPMGALPMLANGSIVLDFDTKPWFVTALGLGFAINLGSSVQASGILYYTQGTV